MDFKILYTPDNGICHPYSEYLAANRSDLIPLYENEIILLRTMSVSEIIARRAANSAPTASVVVETNNDPSVGETAPTPVSAHPAPKGVTIDGKISVEADKGADVFGNERVDYKKYCGRNGEMFTLEDLDKIQDCELVRFASEVLRRDYADADADMPSEGKDEYYGKLRKAIAKVLTKDIRKKLEWAKTKELNQRKSETYKKEI